MGYLDNDTIIVDAILTKHGRKLLAEGAAINPTMFALSDDGVDYTLWNTDSPSGSAGYGHIRAQSHGRTGPRYPD